MLKYYLKNLAILATLMLIGFLVLWPLQPAANVYTDGTLGTEGYSDEEVLDAIEMEESGGDPNAVCPDGCCVGAYQITEIYVDDANRILRLGGCPGLCSYQDRWGREESRYITAIVTTYYSTVDYLGWDVSRLRWNESAARTHRNPNKRNHPSTKAYWLRIKKRLEDGRDG